LPDGTVEVLAVGPADALAELGRWLHDGPPIARVTKVEEKRLDDADVAGFRIG
jgi:acylphosphatase